MSPFAFLLFALISVPLIEIYLLISVGRVIGAGTTVLVVIATAVIGAWLLRWQGLQTLNRVQQTMQQGQLPAKELIEGLILLVTGALLLTPGFFTDVIGFLCLVPSIRGLLAGWFLQRQMHHFSTAQQRSRTTQDGVIIEGEFEAGDMNNKSDHEKLNRPDDGSF